MKCSVCGAEMRESNTDMPFKTDGNRIVILKQLPVIECASCREYLLTDAVMAKVEEILDKADRDAELEIVRFAA